MIKTFSITDKGLTRTVNQDYIYTCEEPVGNLPNLFIVADGMGGHKAGDYASRSAVEIICEQVKLSFEKNPLIILKKAIEEANQRIYEKSKAEEEYHGMGTTVCCATILGKYMQVANVGDSRLYVVNNRITQITKDHSLVQEMVRLGGMNSSLAKNHPKKNIITRAVGGFEKIEVDFFSIELQQGDAVLLCSDGLTNMLEDEEIKMILESQRDVVEKVEELVKAANDHGGRDNISVILIEPFAKDKVDTFS